MAFLELEARTEEGKHMTDTSRPFAEKKFTEVKGHRMAYIDEGEAFHRLPARQPDLVLSLA